MTTARILEAAADVIVLDGWCRGKLGDEDGGVCARGAIYTVLTGVYDPPMRARQRVAMSFSEEQHPLRTVDVWVKREGWENAMYYNDAAGRTKEEVIAMLRAVAATERARESLRDASPEAPTQNTAVPLEPPVAVSA